MAHKNSILSQDPAFYSSYEYEEQKGSSRQKVFVSILLKLLLLLSILLAIYFTFNYVSNMDINFKKFDFWSITKQNEPPTREIKMEVTPTESKMKEKEAGLKRVEVELIVKKVMDNIHKEKVLEVSKTSTTPLMKPTEVTSADEIKSPYLTKEYLEAVKKALGKN